MEKVIDIEDRIPTLKARRRKRTNKKFSILLLLFISTLLIVLYFQSSYSHIQSVKIKGASLFFRRTIHKAKYTSNWRFYVGFP